MKEIDATIAHYQASVPYYTQAFDDRHSRHLDGFLDRLTTEAHILELGCGTGRDAARMEARGFRVDATDGTPAMLVKAKQRYGIEARLMRFDELEACEVYDAVWAHACLFHVPQARLPDILSRIRKSLKPGGWQSASFKLGSQEGVDDRGRWNSLIGRDRIEQLYRDAGFGIEDIVEWSGVGADGVGRAWVTLTVRRGE